ncbi:MAG: BrnT family toxin [Chloroflexota bacterium]|nr:BrnT family toxin [Chloroflexota bacterium]MDQ6906812.1 BrnT family toxin [Chloroflexota bacterium]
MVYFDDLIWDDWNEEHIARHHVGSAEAIEAVAEAASMTRGRDNTYQLVGQTDTGRYLFVVLARRIGRTYYVVSARDATRGEQRTYRRP